MWLVCFRRVVYPENGLRKSIKCCPPNSVRECVHYAEKGPVLRTRLTSRAILGESYLNFRVRCTRLSEQGKITAPRIIEDYGYRHPVVHVNGMNNEPSELLQCLHTARRKCGHRHALAFAARKCFIHGHCEIAAVFQAS